MTVNLKTIKDRVANQSYRKVLVAYDGSENSKRALGKAIQIVKDVDCELTIVVVTDDTSYAAYSMGQSYGPIRADMVDYAKKALSESSERAKQAGITRVLGSVEEGHPGDMILARASEIKADLIVVGRRGIRGIERFLMGSVSSSIVNNSQCDVLVVK